MEFFFSIKNNSSVNKELIRIGKLARINKHFSFHSARHTNATLLIYKGANITTVQKLLGHKNLATTQIYGEVMGSTIVRDLKNVKKGSKLYCLYNISYKDEEGSFSKVNVVLSS